MNTTNVGYSTAKNASIAQEVILSTTMAPVFLSRYSTSDYVHVHITAKWCMSWITSVYKNVYDRNLRVMTSQDWNIVFVTYGHFDNAVI